MECEIIEKEKYERSGVSWCGWFLMRKKIRVVMKEKTEEDKEETMEIGKTERKEVRQRKYRKEKRWILCWEQQRKDKQNLKNSNLDLARGDRDKRKGKFLQEIQVDQWEKVRWCLKHDERSTCLKTAGSEGYFLLIPCKLISSSTRGKDSKENKNEK